jgi:hypothetical protein
MFIRELKWNKDGYHPVGYNWKNYTRTTSNNVLRHDLYHHQLGEDGQVWEELRALGARHRFDDCYQMVVDFLEFDYNKNLMINPYSRVDADACKKEFLEACSEARSNLYFAKLLTDGFNYSSQFSSRAYGDFSKIDFEETFNSRKSIKIDLLTGLLIKEQ